MLRTNAFAAAVGLIFGILVVWWVRPDSDAGAVFLIFASTLVCVVAGSILKFFVGLFRSMLSERKAIASPPGQEKNS
jgi:hypothetical protein